MFIRKRRSVAPVIATLLMVAIAVVGGMLVFVFAQDFFTSTDSMVAPSIELLQIFGYDARDLATADNALRSHAGFTCTGPVGVAGGTMEESDVFAIYVRNMGANDIVIRNVSVFNIKATAAAAASTVATSPTAGTWTVVIDNTKCIAAVTAATALIKAGQDATILVAYLVGDAGIDFTVDPTKAGRPIFVKVETGSGSVFPKQIVNGRSVG